MTKAQKVKMVLAITIVILAACALVGIFYYMYTKVDYTSVDYILQYQDGPMNFNDVSNTICAYSPDDCGYKVLDDMRLDIQYGKMMIHVVPKAFEDAQFMAKLKRIGIEIKFKHNEETGEYQYKVTYWGEPIDEYSRMD